ncbi:TolC family type I secretion outer membrane protein [Nitratireductor indicus C115]|uniref:TolC family type I secretion outer membrane protein n=1 Tax=Nitratireductor indicus C115 TaxID=1231190 RepID=K2P3K9_9HYPH|nr:TolC family type I secretion outer membrane protein [Nitratireductor indicus C115]SFQ31637.1 outer membrane protein, adhesin transport system [Nitratireductor indicus]
MKFKARVTRMLAAALFGSVAFYADNASALSLKEAMAVALESNPEIGQAVENREAIEFELRQARGLYLPSVDLEASVGARRLDNPSRRGVGIEDDPLYPSEVGLSVTQKLFDGGGRRAELERQAARVDSASFRVLERSETIALQVVREYLEYLLQIQIVNESRANLGFHQSMLGDISSLISGGALTEADRQQAQERALSAKARLKEAEEELEAAKIRFYKLVGKPLTNPVMPASVASALPRSLDAAIGIARANNPRIKVANADIDVADAQVDAARSKMFPEISAEGRARTGYDIDGADGRTHDLQARVVARWNLYRGGIDVANEQEQIRRASEQRLVLHQAYREVEEAVRISWDRRQRQIDLSSTLRDQAATNARLVNSYREQLVVGQRSLLDVLGAQNTRYSVNVLSKTAQYAALFAEYRILAATGTLLNTMHLQSAKQSEAYARTEFNVPETAPTETYKRLPSRQVNDLPLDLLAPIRRQ